jgi:excisionase family DNA binding protein
MRRRLLAAGEAAEWLTVRETTIRDYARRGVVPSVKIGRHLRFVEADLVAYVERPARRRWGIRRRLATAVLIYQVGRGWWYTDQVLVTAVGPFCCG